MDFTVGVRGAHSNFSHFISLARLHIVMPIANKGSIAKQKTKEDVWDPVFFTLSGSW